MRAIVFDRIGEPADVLRLEERPIPEPGPVEVRVRMRSRSINPSDLLTVRGLYAKRSLPAVPGLEGMGVVDALGEGVSAFAAGQRVIPLGLVGTWQEYVIAAADRLVPVPDAVPDAIAAQFVVNPLTAWLMVTDALNVQPGQWLLQTAAGSTLGRMILQIAVLRKFKTINVVRRRAQVAELVALGADEVVCTEDEDLGARVRAITGGHGVPAAIEAVGGATGTAAVRCLGKLGTLLAYGLLSGQPIEVDPGHLIFTSATVRGYWLSDWFQTTPANRQQAVMAEVLGHMAAGRIVPPVEAEFDLSEVIAAVRAAETPGRSGKVLLIG